MVGCVSCAGKNLIDFGKEKEMEGKRDREDRWKNKEKPPSEWCRNEN